MISRRHLLTSLSMLPLAGGVMGCAARATTVTAGGTDTSNAAAGGGGATQIPTVGPGARWTGAALSGGTPPTDPVRTTAKPAIHWLLPSDLRLVSNLTIGVDADANGGVKQVDFWVEGQVQTVTTPSIYTDTDANGNARSRYGYWITLNASAFKIISTTGEARIFATAVPNDPTMQNRVIGFNLANGGLYDGNYPLSVFPRAAANDFTLNVRLDGAGGAYTSIASAIAAAKTINGGSPAEAPLILIQQTGAYDLANIAANYGGGKGFCTITAAPGVTATLGRSAAFTPNNPSSWTWTPGWDGIEFRGSGIVFDQKNWSTMVFSSKPAWFNGCKFTNSIGTLYTYYWNGANHPGYGANNMNYWDDCFIEFNSLQAALGAQRYVRGCNIHQYIGDIFSATHYVANNYVRQYDYRFFTGTYGGVVNYTGISITGPAGATVSKTAGDAQGGNLLLRVNGSTVSTIPLGYYSTDTNPTINNLVNAINAYGNGWSASAQGGRGAMRPSQLGTPTGTGSQTFTDLAATSALNLNVGQDIHGDWWQGYSGANIRQNVIIRNNITRDTVGVNASMNNDDNSNGAQAFDHIIKGNVWDGLLDPSGQIPAYGPIYFGSNTRSHYVYENNSGVNSAIRQEDTAGDKTYSSVKNNIIGGSSTSVYGAAQTQDAPWINNFYWLMSNISPLSTWSTNTGNYQFGTAVTYAGQPGNRNNYVITDFHGLFRDALNGDYRPKPGGDLLAHLMPKANTYDGTGAAFAANDAAGAWGSAAAAPNYPF